MDAVGVLASALLRFRSSLTSGRSKRPAGLMFGHHREPQLGRVIM